MSTLSSLPATSLCWHQFLVVTDSARSLVRDRLLRHGPCRVRPPRRRRALGLWLTARIAYAEELPHSAFPKRRQRSREDVGAAGDSAPHWPLEAESLAQVSADRCAWTPPAPGGVLAAPRGRHHRRLTSCPSRRLRQATTSGRWTTGLMVNACTTSGVGCSTSRGISRGGIWRRVSGSSARARTSSTRPSVHPDYRVFLMPTGASPARRGRRWIVPRPGDRA